MQTRRPQSKSRLHNRRGVVAVLVALCLLVLVGMAALALDGGRMYDKRRQVVVAAEAAATATAYQIYQAVSDAAADSKTVDLTAVQAKAKALGVKIAGDNGFANDGVRSTVTINIPPKGGKFVGQSGYIEAIVQYNAPRTFSSVFGKGDLPIRGRAVAATTYVPTKASVLVLDPKKKEAAKLEDAWLHLKGDLIVNSRDKNALVLKKKAQIQADNILVSGGVSRNGKDNSSLSGDLSTKVPATTDPLAGLPAPPKGPDRDLKSQMTVNGKQRIFELEPGTYDEKMEFKKDDVVTMKPGTYYLSKEGFRLADQASLSAENVMIYNASKKEMKFETVGNVEMTPPEDGPYAGITLFQGQKGNIKFRKDADFQMSGTVYAPNGEVRFQQIDATLGGIPDSSDDDDGSDDDGSGPETYSTISVQIIAKTFKIDKKSHVTMLGNGISAMKPIVGVVE